MATVTRYRICASLAVHGLVGDWSIIGGKSGFRRIHRWARQNMDLSLPFPQTSPVEIVTHTT